MMSSRLAIIAAAALAAPASGLRLARPWGGMSSKDTREEQEERAADMAQAVVERKEMRDAAEAEFAKEHGGKFKELMLDLPKSLAQEAKNRPNIDWQEKIHRGILRGLRNISETP